LQKRTTSLSSLTTPSTNPQERLEQLRTVKKAYDNATASKPDIPHSNSVVPALLAVKHLNETIKDAKAAVDSALDQLDSAEHHAKSEETSRADADLLADALQKRIVNLEKTQNEQSSLAPEAAFRKLLSAKSKRKKEFETESQRLYSALIDFIRTRLGAMVAAEEIGGPVVGELSDVSEDMLTAGFSTQGKPKPATAKPISDAMRQRRIDEIWGAVTDDGHAVESEDEAAVAEMTKLIDGLLEISSAKSGSYFDLKRDSAASRFLVRAKVAQFHPKDARKIRLLDFGRELND
jgi:hypothetical protein